MRDVKFNKKCGTEIEVRFSIAFGIHAQKIHWIKYYLNCSDSILYVHHTIVYIDVYSLWIIPNPVVLWCIGEKPKFISDYLGVFSSKGKIHFGFAVCKSDAKTRFKLHTNDVKSRCKKISKIDSLIVKWWQSLMTLDRIFWNIIQILGKMIWFFVHDHWTYRMNSSEHSRGYYKMDSNLIARNWMNIERIDINLVFQNVFLSAVLKCFQSHFEVCILGSLDTGWNL